MDQAARPRKLTNDMSSLHGSNGRECVAVAVEMLRAVDEISSDQWSSKQAGEPRPRCGLGKDGKGTRRRALLLQM